MLFVEQRRYLVISLIGHCLLLIILVVTIDFSSPMIVFENTSQHEPISAVILGDTIKSHILPRTKESSSDKLNHSVSTVQKSIPLKLREKKADAVSVKIKKKAIPDRSFSVDHLLADIKQVRQHEKKQSSIEKKLQKQAEKSLRQHLLNDAVKLATEQPRFSQGIVNKYKALIIQAISEHWIIPLQTNKALSSELMINLAPGGKVLQVNVVKTSGDPSLDLSARAAVYKASPLPVPSDPSQFEAFRRFTLKVKPENML